MEDKSLQRSFGILYLHVAMQTLDGTHNLKT